MQSINRAERGRSSRELAKRAEWGTLEEFTQSRIQSWLQEVLEEEVTDLRGPGKVGTAGGGGCAGRIPQRARQEAALIDDGRHDRSEAAAGAGLEQRFESRLLPLFVRRTAEVGELLPQLYLDGLAQGDFELALRGLLGDGAPLSASSLERLRKRLFFRNPLRGSRRHQREHANHTLIQHLCRKLTSANTPIVKMDRDFHHARWAASHVEF